MHRCDPGCSSVKSAIIIRIGKRIKIDISSYHVTIFGEKNLPTAAGGTPPDPLHLPNICPVFLVLHYGHRTHNAPSIKEGQEFFEGQRLLKIGLKPKKFRAYGATLWRLETRC